MFERPDEPISAIAPEQARLRFSFSDRDVWAALEALRDLSPVQAVLLFRVCALSRLEGYCWAGQEHLADLCWCSVRALRTATKALCDRGLLVTVRTREGLRYLPQWLALGLGPLQPAEAADPDRQNLPMHPDQGLDQQQRAAAGRRRIPQRAPAMPLAAALSLVDPRDRSHDPPDAPQAPEPPASKPRVGGSLGTRQTEPRPAAGPVHAEGGCASPRQGALRGCRPPLSPRDTAALLELPDGALALRLLERQRLPPEDATWALRRLQGYQRMQSAVRILAIILRDDLDAMRANRAERREAIAMGELPPARAAPRKGVPRRLECPKFKPRGCSKAMLKLFERYVS